MSLFKNLIKELRKANDSGNVSPELIDQLIPVCISSMMALNSEEISEMEGEETDPITALQVTRNQLLDYIDHLMLTIHNNEFDFES